MQTAMYAHTHGLGYREGENNRTRSVPADQLVPTQVAVDAERAGFHSMWFPDHVCMPLETASAHVANVTGKRSYSPRHEMLDAAVVMGAVATTTSTLKLGTSVLVAPYRGPLNDARQFATVDVLSGGRLILGVGVGWMAEEFAALGLDHRERGARTLEAIEIYKRAWTEPVVEFDGEHYQFHDISMDPKPVQKPRPPIIYGGVTELGAKRAARHCDGFYPLFLDPFAETHRYDAHQDIIRRILDEAGRAENTFTMMGAVTVHLTSEANATGPDGQRMICSGSVEQVLDDLQAFAASGYSMMVMKLVCPTGEVTELREIIEQVGQDIIPTADSFVPSGGWQQSL
ncbi:MAG: putative F420-dependent oxidoreductase [Candidatus Poriferisodalaceae bacterium]|jgi:probable F420-dependent oxidoreductase